MATRRAEFIVAVLPRWKEQVIKLVARCLAIKGTPVGFIYHKKTSDVEMTVNDIARSQAEDAVNRVRANNN